MSFEGISSDEYLESVRQEHEAFLSQLETYAVIGIATGDWNSLYKLVSEFHLCKQIQQSLDEKNENSNA